MEDKLENILLKHLDLLQQSRDWWTPLGLFLSKPKEFGEMCFIFVGMISFAWLVVSVIRAIAIKNTNSDDQ